MENDEVILENQEETLEQKLVAKFILLDAEAKRLAALTEEKKKERDDVEAELVDFLNDENKKSSGRFKGIGHVTCLEPSVGKAWVVQGREEVFFEYLRQKGREDLIKTEVHNASLRAFVNQSLKALAVGDAEAELPPGLVEYVLVQKLRAYPEKGK